MKKYIALIGRPNVGKSSIFNRLINENKAIISDIPGVTLDRLYGEVKYKDYTFTLIDTGGIESGNNINDNIKLQAMIAMEEADIILFIVDNNSELTSDDYLIRDILRKTKKQVIVVVNKVDNTKKSENIYNFYELGFPSVIGVSASHNLGFDELLKEIVKDFQETTEENTFIPAFCIIGRPNVGKSSLTNALLNEERVIVSDIPGTTRDAVDTKFTYDKNEYLVVDTAGMRKKGKIYESLEKYSLIRSLKAIDKSDVCVIVISAEEGIIEHDKHIVSYATESGKGIVLAINKWDTIDDPNQEIKKWKLLIENEFQFIPYAKIVFLSAKTKKRVHTLMPEIISAYENARKEIKTSLLNNVISDAVSLHEPPSYKGKRLKIFFVSQTGITPPKFTFSVNNKGLVHFSYERYLENKIRESFDLSGTPIIIKFKNKGSKDE